MKIKEFPYKSFKIEIHTDEDTQNSREWDNLGIMVCWHRRYNLGDLQPKYNSIDFLRDLAADYHQDIENATADEIEEILEKNFIILPLFLYDHSGLRIKVGNFRGLLPQGHAEFDTMQVGFIYVSGKTIKKEYGADNVKNREMARKVLVGEVETYDQYLSGDVYSYIIYDDEENNLDSVCGFFGLEYCEEQAELAADYCVENANKEACLI